MKTLEQWRQEQAQKEVTWQALAQGNPIFRLFPHIAKCGHHSPWRFKVFIARQWFQCEDALEMAKYCPECTVTRLKKVLIAELSLAVPCACCGGPIYENMMVGAEILTGPPLELPVTYTPEGLPLLCPLCARVGVNVYGYWDGTVAIRKGEKELISMMSV